jgi:hypothetical protein
MKSRPGHTILQCIGHIIGVDNLFLSVPDEGYSRKRVVRNKFDIYVFIPKDTTTDSSGNRCPSLVQTQKCVNFYFIENNLFSPCYSWKLLIWRQTTIIRSNYSIAGEGWAPFFVVSQWTFSEDTTTESSGNRCPSLVQTQKCVNFIQVKFQPAPLNMVKQSITNQMLPKTEKVHCEGAIKPKGLNRIAKICYGHICLREVNISFY